MDPSLRGRPSNVAIERVLALPVRREILQMRFDVKGDARGVRPERAIDGPSPSCCARRGPTSAGARP
jgi:hypothetical protein